jgi:Transposase IS4
VFQLAKTLPYSTDEFTLFLDNYFCNTALFLKLQELGIGACGTVRKSITKKLFPTFVGVKGANTTPMEWGTIRGQVVDNKVLVAIWQDNSVVGFMSTVHTGLEYVVCQRRRSKDTSTNASISQAPFAVQEPCSQGESAYKHRKPLPIPGMVDDYNYSMNGVDIADQLRAQLKTQTRSRRSWLPLHYWMLDTALVNSYQLWRWHKESLLKPGEKQKRSDRADHAEFRYAIVKGLLKPSKPRISARTAKKGHQDLAPLFQLPVEYHQLVSNRKSLWCYYCRLKGMEAKKARERPPEQWRSRWECSLCKVQLCKKKGCFEAFHELEVEEPVPEPQSEL